MANTHVPNDGGRDNTLDSLLLPGTTSDIRDLYHGLERDAETYEFGPLEDGVIVLDTETTGLSFRDCELIEIAAARLRGREVVDRFQTFVHPGRPIPREIQRLTHITDLDVMDAPSSREAVAALSDFVGGAPVLAHNATFDRTFIEKVKGGHEVSDFWIDTLALSRIALPRLSSHRLSDMAQAFHCDSVTHRAMDDVDALCGMWRIILCGLRALPEGLLSFLADMQADVDWQFRPVISYVASTLNDEPFDLKAIRKTLVSTRYSDSSAPGKQAGDGESKAIPTRQEIASYFADDGPLAETFSSYERRSSQVKMALEVRDALESKTDLALEAGTGVGKTIAYLIPEALFARNNTVSVGVATKTNALADQLVTHDLPLVNRIIPGGITYYSLKGYEHYPCILRMDQTAAGSWNDEGLGSGSAANHEDDILTALAVAYTFVCQSVDGDLDALGIRWKVVPRELLAIGPRECIHNRCPYYPNECLLHGARRRAANADVVVTNHALLLRNIAADNALLPPIKNWVVDEAHGFEDETRRQWSYEVCSDDIRHIFEVLGDTKSGVLHSLIVESTGLEGSTLVIGLLSKTAAAVSRARESFEQFFRALHELARLSNDKGEYGSINLWIDESVRQTDVWRSLAEAGSLCIDRLQAVIADAKRSQESLTGQSERLASQLEMPIRRLSDVYDSLRLVIREKDAAYVYSAQLYRQKRRSVQESLVAQKLDVGETLASEWLSQMDSVVFTSATLAVGESFEHFEHAVGMDRLPTESRREVALRSDYDFDSHMAVVVPDDLPQPNERDYLASLSDLLFDIHKSMSGSVLTLFTNRREMEAAYRDVQPRLASIGLTLLCQDRGSSTRRLGQEFTSDKSASLFALKSFWEGFDAAGDTLRCVVVTKLPFASPKDPLVRERDLRDRRAWWKYSLPEAVISVKQAVGRLIRSSQDRGIIVIADSRVVKKRYGKQFLDSLPSDNCISLGKAQVGRYISLWRKSQE